ncbi:S8 family peptidase [Xylanibacillus composti]|uniref:Peptidase S8/S53 domain-containing protein n=1 Tax=Xylanibacillus composti TaxID=1572762 RepID=A0A8J4GZW6_9BACL|nr:S8 family serine peptidase [Xylanibacillus composti]GIQ68264.1 hypothetical protein XYCOK13_10880 [Xylanibacillus composti]
MKHRLQRLFLCFVLLSSPFLYVYGKADFQKDEVIIAVLDTGIDDSHELLRGRVIQGFDFIDRDWISEDQDGHGTHVAGIIAREAPGARILSVRIIDNDNDVKYSHAAILYAISQGADVINMSFVEPYQPLTQWAIQYGLSKGVTFVAASGNQGLEEVGYPARYNGVYSISGYEEDGHQFFGNFGENVDYLAPGWKVESAAPDGGFATKSGTSMSAAYVSGVLGYMHTAKPDIKRKELRELLDARSYEVTKISEAASTVQGRSERQLDSIAANAGVDAQVRIPAGSGEARPYKVIDKARIEAGLLAD